MLADCPIEVVGLDAYPDVVPAEEDGTTFAENARKKALAVASQTGELALADDSGLCVAALNDRPGVYSARYAGENASDAANNALLLREMAAVADGQRQAAYFCVMALCTPQGECQLFEGRLDGEILRHEVGSGGFGYDPLFRVCGDERSVAQISLEEKNRFSHRARALRQVIEVLKGKFVA